MSRRNFLLGLGAGTLLSACRSVPPPPAEPITPEQALYLESRERMLKKFGRPGYELVVDAMKDQEFLGVEFFPEHAKYSFHRKGGQSLRNGSKSMQSAPPPERVQILWRDSSKFVPDGRVVYAGNIIGDELIEVGTRIPQELIDDLKRDPKGSLRLKFRMSDQGTLFGWDIQRILNPMGFSREEIRRRNILLSVEHFFAGGDFREAEIINGKAVRKGWYIDQRTGQKIETDF